MKKLNTKREKIFDGIDEKLYKTHFKIGNTKVKVEDFLPNSLRDLKDVLPHDDFENILGDNIELIKSLIPKYKNEDNLECYFLIKNELLFVFSLGEFQPARYLFYVESVWEMQEAKLLV